jgi:secreted trypsin-like serine protease
MALLQLLSLATTSSAWAIYGGQKAAPNELPTVVALTLDNEIVCSGTIVTPNLILTAGHCLWGEAFKDISRIRIYTGLGHLDRKIPENDSRLLAIKKVKIHPEFEVFSLKNDYGYIQLETPILDIQPTAVLTHKEIDGLKKNSKLVVAGFGYDELDGAGIKRFGRIPYLKRANEKFQLADPKGMTDSCMYDSGGPAFLKMPSGELRLAGIVSDALFAMSCGPGGVYADAASAYEWAEKDLSVTANENK